MKTSKLWIFFRNASAGSEVGVPAIAPEDRTGAGWGWIRTRSACQGHEHRWSSRSNHRRGEDAEGGRVRLRAGWSAVRVSAAEGGAASERDPAAGSLYDAAWCACLPHHRIRRIRLFAVSKRRDIFDRRPDDIYGPSVPRTPTLLSISPAVSTGSKSTPIPALYEIDPFA